MSYTVDCNCCGKPFIKKSNISQATNCMDCFELTESGRERVRERRLELHYEKLEHETKGAYLICFEDQVEPIWLPKSQVELEDTIIHIPLWLVLEKGIQKYEK